MFDGRGRYAKIIETTTSTPSTRFFLWLGSRPIEERDAAGAIVNQFFGRGFKVGSAKHFFTFDHQGSLRDMSDNSGTLESICLYGPYGDCRKLLNSVPVDFGYLGNFFHSRSDLMLTQYRQYNVRLGVWISRDPLGEAGGYNLYGYASNSPISLSDKIGLVPGDPFLTADEAAFDALTYINPTSIRENVEYAGVIYLSCEGSFYASGPRRGRLGGSDPGRAPFRTTLVGIYHTHGTYSLSNGTRTTFDKDQFGSEDFSPQDKFYAYQLSNSHPGLRSYLATPSSRIGIFDTSTGKTSWSSPFIDPRMVP